MVAAGVAHQLLAGIVVDRDPEVELVLVVVVDALDGRRAPVEDLVVGVAALAEAQHGLGAQAVGDARRPRPRARPAARRRRPGSESVVRPCRAMTSRGRGGGAGDHLLARRGRRRRSPRARRRRGRARAAAAPPRSRCRRRGRRGSRAPGADGRAARWPRRAARRRPRWRAPGRCCTLSASGASSGETKRPPTIVRTGCVESRLCARAPGGRGPRRPAWCCARTASTRQRPSPRSSAVIRTRPWRLPISNGSTCGVAARSASVRPAASSRRGTAWWPWPAPCRKRTSPLSTALAVGERDALHAQLVERARRLLRVGGRVDDPERRGRRVLRRVRRVGVEGVALEQQRAQELLERAVHLSPPPAARPRTRRRTAGPRGAPARERVDRVVVQAHPALRWGSSAPSSRATWPRACASRPSTSTG